MAAFLSPHCRGTYGIVFEGSKNEIPYGEILNICPW